MSGHPAHHTGGPRFPASALLAVLLSCAFASVARADPGEAALKQIPFKALSLEPQAPGGAFAPAAEETSAVSIEVGANATQGQPTTVVVSGESEAASELFVYVSTRSVCEESPQEEYPGESDETVVLGVAGEPVGAGEFETSYDFTPGPSATYTVCAYLDESEGAIPEAVGTATFPSTTLEEIAEAEEQAAKAKSQEEEREVKAKAEGEAVGAREAAARAAREAAAKAAQEAAASAAGEAEARAAGEAAAAAAKEQAEAEQAAKIEAARAKPVARLAVTPVAHDGPTTARPGYTALKVTTSPFAFVTVELTRRKRETLRIEWGERADAVAEKVPWSCRNPGGTYSYTVTARTDVGKKLTRSGSFAPVTAARCRALVRGEGDAARQRRAHEFEEAVVRRNAAEREEQEREENACREEGGTPTIVLLPGGPPWLCENPR